MLLETITRVNVPKLNLIVIKKAKMGYQKKRRRKATAAELKKQKQEQAVVGGRHWHATTCPPAPLHKALQDFTSFYKAA